MSEGTQKKTVLTEGSIVKHHLLGSDNLLLVGGPYNLCLAVRSEKMPYIRLPAKPVKRDLHAQRSLVAPWPTTDGSVVYDNTGKRHITGSMIFRFRETTPTEVNDI
jgi:hypothetical protein